MSNVINFQVERALRQTGLHRSLIEDIVEDGFNPLDPIEVEQYFDWFSVSATIEMEWKEDPIQKLLNDIVNEVE